MVMYGVAMPCAELEGVFSEDGHPAAAWHNQHIQAILGAAGQQREVRGGRRRHRIILSGGGMPLSRCCAAAGVAA
jgi:hypothetical protein